MLHKGLVLHRAHGACRRPGDLVHIGGVDMDGHFEIGAVTFIVRAQVFLSASDAGELAAQVLHERIQALKPGLLLEGPAIAELVGVYGVDGIVNTTHELPGRRAAGRQR